MANRDARARPTRSAIRCRAPAIGSIAVVTSTQRKIGILGRDEKIAGQRKLETAAEGDALHHGHRRDLQHLDGAIRDVDFRDERAEPVDVLARPFANFAAEAEMRPLGANHQHADIAFAGLVNRVAQTSAKRRSSRL